MGGTLFFRVALEALCFALLCLSLGMNNLTSPQQGKVRYAPLASYTPRLEHGHGDLS